VKRILAVWLLLLAGIFFQPQVVGAFGSGEQNVVGAQDIPGSGAYQEAGASATFTNLTPSSTIHVQGTIVQLLAAASNTAVTNSMLVNIFYTSLQATSFSSGMLINIYTGESGSEVCLICGLELQSTQQYGYDGWNFIIPITVPASKKISASVSANVANSTDVVGIHTALYAGGFGAIGVDNISANTATGFGTAFTPGNGSKSSYVQLVASAAHSYKGIFFKFDNQGVANTNYSYCAMDIENGSTVIIPNYKMWQSGGNNWQQANSSYIPMNISAGTSISVRGQCADTMGAAGLALYGVY